jgi:hypothetical protein
MITTLIRKFFRNLLLRCLILAFTGDRTASVFEDPAETVEPSAAAAAVQALDQMSSGLSLVLLPVTAYQVITGSGP